MIVVLRDTKKHIELIPRYGEGRWKGNLLGVWAKTIICVSLERVEVW